MKGYEKTVNALSQFIISKHLFVIIHMAYKRLSMYYNGWPFQSLVRFYETLNTHSACTKLVTAFKKQVRVNFFYRKLMKTGTCLQGGITTHY